MAKKGLGRGLGALFDTSPSQEMSVEPTAKPPAKKSNDASPISGDITYVKLSEIEPNKKQPRKNFDKEKIEALALSIKENGFVQPIIITPSQEGMYKIVAGERRWRAAKELKLKEIPVLIRDYTDEQIASVALIENLQREDLNPIEEALGYNLLMEEFSMTQEAVAKRIGKSRSAVANALRLLSLDNSIKNAIISGAISSGHARAILSVEDKKLRLAMLKIIVDDGLNVRQAEALAKQIIKKSPKKKPLSSAQLSAIEETEAMLCEAFGTKVKIHSNGKKGRIEIEYFGNDDLERIINMFNIQGE